MKGLVEEPRAILLVEDSEDDELLTRRAFARNGFLNPIRVARDGVSALEMLHAEDAVLPVLVLLDLNLPKLGGLDVLKRLRADPRTALLPVVVLTSSQRDVDIVSSYRFGANAFVAKPVDYREFLEAARQLGMFWLLLNKPPPVA